MLHEEVAAHYRERGYRVDERVKVRGDSGQVHAVDLVAQGPLGNLVIAIEDAGGFEGPEMHAVKRAAKDIGATPVMAARRIPDGLRRQAAQAGVVLLDEAAMQAVPEPEPSFTEELEHPPWPGTGTAETTKSTDPGFWHYPRKEETEEEPRATGFGWLPAEPEETVARAPLMSAPSTEAIPTRPPGTAPAPNRPTASVPARPAAQTTATTGLDWRWIVTAGVFGATAGGVFYALSRILG